MGSEHKICVLIFSTTFFSETLLILRKTERDIIVMCIGLHVKYPLLVFM